MLTKKLMEKTPNKNDETNHTYKLSLSLFEPILLLPFINAEYISKYDKEGTYLNSILPSENKLNKAKVVFTNEYKSFNWLGFNFEWTTLKKVA